MPKAASVGLEGSSSGGTDTARVSYLLRQAKEALAEKPIHTYITAVARLSCSRRLVLRSVSISTATLPPTSVGTAPLPPAPFSAGFPSWIRAVPFLSVHLLCLAVFYTGVNTLALLLCGLCYAVRMFGITAGYHRYFSHRSYKTSRIFQFLLAWLGCSALQKGPLWWSAHHRHHHLHSDTEDDPHSPRVRSFWWSHVGWILSAAHEVMDSKVVRDWLRYPELRWLNRNHWIPGIALAVLCWLIGGWTGLVWGFFVSTVLLYHAVFTVNSLCHIFGRRRYATTDESRNNLLVALFTFGEGWHNNHHYYQSSANQGFFWWEIDLSYYLLRLLALFGLVWDIRKPSQKHLLGQAGRRPRGSAPAATSVT